MSEESLIIEPESLPREWGVKKLGALVQPSKIRSNPGEDADSPYLALEHIESGSGRIIGKGTGSESISTKTTFKSGDILFPKLRPYLNKTCRAPFDGVGTTEFYVLPKSPALDSGFLCHFLRQQAVVSFVNHHANGVQLPRTNFKVLAEIDIPLPEPKIQQSIASLLDKINDHQQNAKERLDRARVALRRFRRSAIAAACDGSLSSDWRHRESDRCAILPPEEVESFYSISPDIAGEIPSSWSWVHLGKACRLGRGKFSIRPRNDPRYFGGPHPFIQIGCLPREGGRISICEQWLNDAGLEISKKFPAGTALIAIVGATIANTGILAHDSCCPDSLVAIQSDDPVRVRYLELYLRRIKEFVRGLSYAGGGQPNINLKTLDVIPVPLPPDDEQREIVRRIDELFAVSDRIEVAIAATAKRVNRTFQSTLAAAFRGELSTPEKPVP